MPLLARYRTALIVVCGALTLYALLGFLAVPYAVQTYGVPALSDKLRHPVFLGDFAFNPFTFALTLSDFEIQEADGTPMLGFQELFVNFEGTSLLRSAYIFDEIRATFPFGFVHIFKDGALNILSLLPPPNENALEPEERDSSRPTTPAAPLPAVNIRLLSVRQGVVEFRDDSKLKPVRIDVVPIEITLRHFSTRQGQENAYAFTAEFGKGETLNWEGDIHLEPLSSNGRVSLSDVQLKTFWPSIRDQFSFDILSGTVNLDARYRFDMTATPLNLQVKEATVALSDFRMAPTGVGEPVVTMPSFEIGGLEADLVKRALNVGSIRMTGAGIRAWLAPDGVLNLMALLPPREKAPSAIPADHKPVSPWSVSVQEIAVDQTHVDFEDRSLQTPASVTLDVRHASVRDVRWPFKEAMQVGIDVRLNEQGTIEGQGTVRLDPMQADMKVSLAHIAFRPFQSYLDRMVKVEVQDGELELSGNVQYRAPSGDEPMLRYAGQVAVNALKIADKMTHKDFLRWQALALNQVTAQVAPTRAKIGAIVLREPSVVLAINEDGSTNVGRALQVTDPSPVQPKAARQTLKTAARKDTGATPVTIDIVTISKMSAVLVDESLQPPVTTGLYDLGGTVKGLSSERVAKANVSLSGKVDRVAPLKIQGQINPLSDDTFTNLAFTLQGADLTALSPYAGKYAGYPISKGKLSLDLAYRLSNKQLAGENKVLIDQFTFGEKTESPDATSLPVRLAVGLLKDRSGLIDIDMPVRGDLREPDFKYGRVLLNALVNVITKVVTSPFAALGGLVGGSGEDLQYIEFPAGAETLDAAGAKKVDSIAKALQQRPALRVEIIGTADRTRDRDALALQKISAEVQRRFTKNGTKNLHGAPSPEREFEFLSDLYAEKLGKQPIKEEATPEGKVVQRVLTADELRQQLLPAIPVEESELRSLAQARARAIREQLIAPDRLSEERVFLVDVELGDSRGETVRARLNLTGN
jgi:hypothetical protein